jgi:Fe-S cluster assembly protein SufD
MTPEYLHNQLEARLSELPGGAAVAAAREAAFATFARQGFPTRKLEAWHYTDLKRIADTELELFPSAPGAADPAEWLSASGIDSDAAALVFVDGFLVGDFAADKLGGGVDVSSLAESLEKLGPIMAADQLQSHPLAALNVAFACHGARIGVSAGTEVDVPLHLLFVSQSTRPQACQPQILIDVGANARAEVNIHFVGGADHSSWVNAVTRIALAKGAQLTIQRTQDYGPAQTHTELTDARLAADAALSVNMVDVGGALVRNDLHVRLAEPGASCELTGLLLCSADQHVDNFINVDHLAAHTTSEQRFRSIIGDRGRGVFRGKVSVHKGTHAISADQSSDNLLLAETAEINTKPELEIYADDVKCSHGATVGELDDSHLFYLRSRGIPEPVARGLLTLAFARSLLAESSWLDIDDRIVDKFGLALPEDVGWVPSS